jgi:hypothetical protein
VSSKGGGLALGSGGAGHTICRRVAVSVVFACRGLRRGIGHVRRAGQPRKGERQDDGVDPALPEDVAVTVQVDVLGQRALRPFRCLIISSGPKKLDQFLAFDGHARSFGCSRDGRSLFGRMLASACPLPVPGSAVKPGEVGAAVSAGAQQVAFGTTVRGDTQPH